MKSLSMRMTVLIALFLTCVLLTLQAYSAEVDQFTHRSQQLTDSTKLIDTEIKRLVNQSVNEANKEMKGFFSQTSCGSDETFDNARQILLTKLYKNLVTQNPIGILESFANKNASKKATRLEDSIYASTSSSIVKKYGLSPVIQIGKTQIGTDKLGHFINEGYTFFLNSKGQEDPLQRSKLVLTNSQNSENDMYGTKTTFIKSYADMAANYEGFNFWKNMCFENFSRDEYGKRKQKKCSPESFIQCQNGEWSLNPTHTISIAEFVSSAWDEGINCSLYSTPEFTKSVYNEMNKRTGSFQGNPERPCPADIQECKNIQIKYSQFQVYDQIISPPCLEIAKNRPQVFSERHLRYNTEEWDRRIDSKGKIKKQLPQTSGTNL